MGLALTLRVAVIPSALGDVALHSAHGGAWWRHWAAPAATATRATSLCAAASSTTARVSTPEPL